MRSRAYDVADVDGDNNLQRNELEIVLAALRPHDPPGPDAVDKVWLALRPADKDAREVRRLFGQYDEDNSGTISSQELEKILCEVVFDQGRLAATSPTRAQEELTAVAEDYLRRFDATGRGELNCDQVLQLYESCLQRPDISAAAKLKSESLSWEDFLRGLPAARADPEVRISDCAQSNVHTNLKSGPLTDRAHAGGPLSSERMGAGFAVRLTSTFSLATHFLIQI